ncbi:YdjY domain-containing protein [Lagierella sp.]|uniref:YdjY domain-containing protein n=1 Tax=Lagierella sp. TaxID=2849657 RepID=UPI00262E3C6B|nr:YdjY domain-containing protein [Lagierella sp.]
MNNLKKLLLVFVIACLMVTGCAKGNNKGTDSEASPMQGVSESSPLAVDKEKKTVTLYTTFNGKFLTEPTRHLVIYNKGKLADMSVFSSYVSPEDFHKALEDIGAKPGDNMTPDNASKTLTEGMPLKVTLYWAGNENGTDVNDAIVDSNGKKIDMKFSGNLQNSKDFNTGCISCLDSCFVGITSNATYPLGAIEETKEVEFKPDAEKLPKDKEPVAIVYSID